MKSNQKFSIILFTFLIILSACSKQGQIQPSPISTVTFFTYTPEPTFVVTIPSKGLLKNYLLVSAEAAPGTQCTLTFIPKSGEMLVMEAVANTEGECVWRWKLEESYGRGAARLIFTIDGVSDTHFIEIHSSF